MLRAAIIGCGNIAGGYDTNSPGSQILTHAKAYASNSLTKLVAASDPNEAQLKAFADAWDVSGRFTDCSQLLEQEKIDIVSICAPNEFHYDLLKTVVPFQPKAIICEKPLALSFREGEEMIRLCREKSILLAVNYMRRWDAKLIALGERIHRGDFGNCQNARVYYTKGVFHNASHAINLLRAWLGPAGNAQVWNAAPWGKCDLSASFMLPFAKCEDVVFQGASADFYNFFELELVMEKARILLPGGGSSINITHTEPSPIVRGEQRLSIAPEVIPGSLMYALKAVIDDVVLGITAGKPLSMPAEDALETVRICENIRTLGGFNA